jgi:S-adenosylmethionine hydrolase
LVEHQPEAIGAQPLFDPVRCETRLSRVIHVDGWGNLITGLPAADVGLDREIDAGPERVRNAAIFDAVGQGDTFWYENSMGLVEIAANQDNAAQRLGLKIGDPVRVG